MAKDDSDIAFVAAQRLASEVAAHRAASGAASEASIQTLREMNRILFLASGAAAGSILVWLVDAVEGNVPLAAFSLAVVAVAIFIAITFVGFLLLDGHALRQRASSSHSLDLAHATQELEIAYTSAALAGLRRPTDDLEAPIRKKLKQLSDRNPFEFPKSEARLGPSHKLTMCLAKRSRWILLLASISFVIALGCTVAAIFWKYLDANAALTEGSAGSVATPLLLTALT